MQRQLEHQQICNDSYRTSADMQRQLENQQICNDSYRTSADMQRQLGRLQIYCMYIVHVQLYIVPCTIWWSEYTPFSFFRNWIHCCRSGIFSKNRQIWCCAFSFHFQQITETLKMTLFWKILQIPSFYFKEQLPKRKM